MRKPLEVASDRRSIHAERLRDALHRPFVVAVKVLGDAGLFDGYVKATCPDRTRFERKVARKMLRGLDKA